MDLQKVYGAYLCLSFVSRGRTSGACPLHRQLAVSERILQSPNRLLAFGMRENAGRRRSPDSVLVPNAIAYMKPLNSRSTAKRANQLPTAVDIFFPWPNRLSFV